MKAILICAAVGAFLPRTALAQNDTTFTDVNDSTIVLQTVTIKSQTPRSRVKGDAIRTIVVGSILEKAGTCADVLNRVPSLKCDEDGIVEVLGRGEAEVYVNGRKVQDLRELNRIQSDQIKTIDVVQAPGAQYSASVKAVVRIALKKNKGEGLGFVEKAGAAYRYGFAADNNLDVNYRIGGLDVTGSFWAGVDHSQKYFQNNDLVYNVGEHSFLGKSTQQAPLRWSGWSPQLLVNYTLDERHSFGAYYKYDDRPSQTINGWLNTETYEDEQYKELLESAIRQKITFGKHIFNAYYNGSVGGLDINLNIDGFFDIHDDTNGTDEKVTDISGNVSMRKVGNYTRSKNRFWACKLVLTHPLWGGNLTVGGEYSHNNRTDVYSVESRASLPMSNTDTRISETAVSGFVEYGRQFGRVHAMAGIRCEYLKTDYYEFDVKQKDVSRSYGNWFPTLSLNMPVGRVQMSLSYRQDIKRPDYGNLTGSTIYVNKYAYQTGNPYLKPTYTHTLLFNAAYRAFNFTANHSKTKDVVTLATEPYPGSDDPLLSIIHPVNSSDDYYRTVLSASYRPIIGRWHPTWSIGWVMQNFKALTAAGDEKVLDHPFWQLGWNNDIELPAQFRLNAFVQVRTRGDYNNVRTDRAACNVGLGIQRDFDLKSRGRLTADLRCYDIFNSYESKVTIFGIREMTSFTPARRYFALTLTWKFNEAKSKYRGTGAGLEQRERM